jgi:hypothetical protein
MLALLKVRLRGGAWLLNPTETPHPEAEKVLGRGDSGAGRAGLTAL